MLNLLQLLRDCYSPLDRRNIVDSGLIKSATLTPDTTAPGATIRGVPQRFFVQITLHAPGTDESVNAQLLAQIENRLLGLETISQVNVTLLPPLFPILLRRD